MFVVFLQELITTVMIEGTTALQTSLDLNNSYHI